MPALPGRKRPWRGGTDGGVLVPDEAGVLFFQGPPSNLGCYNGRGNTTRKELPRGSFTFGSDAAAVRSCCPIRGIFQNVTRKDKAPISRHANYDTCGVQRASSTHTRKRARPHRVPFGVWLTALCMKGSYIVCRHVVDMRRTRISAWRRRSCMSVAFLFCFPRNLLQRPREKEDGL